MRLGMMQPYFFPYLGYFALISATDRWVVFDTAQYIRRGWVNRNRVLSTGQFGWKYFRVPIAKCSRETSIRDVRIDETHDWRTQLIRDLDCYQLRRAPFYDETVDLLTRVFKTANGSLVNLLKKGLAETCRHIGLVYAAQTFSEMPGRPTDTADPGQWALRVAEALKADVYINPPAGRDLFDPKLFQSAGIRLEFLEHNLPEYDQRQHSFLAGLSIIDVLMWNGRVVTRQLIDDFRLTVA